MLRIARAIGLPGIALLAAFAPAWPELAAAWRANEWSTHGFLVPFVSLWAAAGIAGARRSLALRPDARGLAPLALAVVAYAAGLGAGWPALVGLALVAAVASLVWLRCGAAWVRALAFPLGFLAFAIPLPDAWVAPVIVRLQLLVSHVGVEIARALGLAVYRDGNVIELPGGDALFVAEACSGITSVVTLIPIAVVLAYFTDRSPRRRVALVASVVPLALLGNLVRVVGTIVAATRVGSRAATEGSWHEAAGVLTYVLGCLALLAVGAVLRRAWPDARDARTASRVA
ncbi:MAG: exosortase/archaeosortase family protein [Myxococcota bacterium]